MNQTQPPILLTVYAIHDFQAENPDELSFSAGEPIDVTEKDDQYGDGWWQGRNTKGAYGLFPQAYTSSQPTLPANSNCQPTMNETLFDVQKAIDSINHPPSSTVSLTNGIPSSLLTEHPSSTQLNPDHSEDDDDRSRSDHHLTWDANNGGAAKARTALAEKARADALAHQSVMDRLKSASNTLYSHPASASSSRVSIPELNEIDLSEESGDDEEDRMAYSSRAQDQFQGFSHSKNQNHLSQSSTLNPRDKLIGATQKSGLDGDHDSSRFASGPFSAAAIALGLAHSPVASSKSANSPNHARNHSLPYHTHKPGQLSSSSVLSDLSAGARAAINATSPPIASTLRMSREFSQQTYQLQSSDRINSDSPSLSHHDPTASRNRSPASQDKTPTPVFASTFPDSQLPPTSAPLASPGSTQEHLKSPTGLMPGSSDLIEPSHGRQRSASSVGSGIFFRQQASSPLRPHSPANSAAPINSTNINTSNSTADSSSVQGSRSRSSSRLAAIEDQLASPATSTFPSVTGKHHVGAGSFSSIVNGTGVKSTFMDPREWTVTDVMEWGKTKGLDEVTISKFSEHEITGDVLLELDMNSLKEIDLVAFGRRVKVTKAIDELRKALQSSQQGISSSSPNPDSIKSPSPQFDSIHGVQDTRSNSYTHRRSESTSDSTRPGKEFITPDMADQISPIVNQRLMISSNLEDISDHDHELAKPHSVRSGPQNPLPSIVTDVKKSTAISFSGLDHRPEADLDSSFTGDSPPNWQHTRQREVATGHIEYPRRPHSAHFYREAEDAVLSPDNLAEKAELHDNFNPTPLVIHEESINTKKSRKNLAKQAKQQRPGTANSILSKKPFSIGETSIDPPSSPERSSSGRPSAEGKSRSSFLGNLRGRKPPPQLTTPGSPSHPSPPQKLASPVSATTYSDGAGNKSRGIFTFGHHHQQAQQIQHLTPILHDSNSKESIPKFNVDEKRNGTTKTAAERIGIPDHIGWMRKKGEKYPTWKMRYFILKNSNLYYLKSENEVRIKGLIKLGGYKVVMDDDVNPGRYGFKIIHDDGSSHAFSADDSKLLRDWMKAMMKATIDRDWLAPVISSCNIPTMPISEAQKMFPPPRPPSPASRARAQKARLAANPEILNTKDPAMLMSLQRLQQQQPQQRPISPPESLRPKRSIHRKQPNLAGLSSPPEPALFKPTVADQTLMNWINTTLSRSSNTNQRIQDFSGSLRSGLVIVKLIESLTDVKSGIDFENYTGGDRMDLYFGVFDYLNSQRIPLDGYALNDMISGDPIKNREFLSRIYTKFNRSRPAFVTAAL